MATPGKRRKTKRVARARTKTKQQRKNYTKNAIADVGPVSLAEAKALAHAKKPKLAVHAARESAAPPASPAPLGAERQRLEQERHDEFARRIQEYKAIMGIMKK